MSDINQEVSTVKEEQSELVLTSVEKLTQLPVVEQTIGVASNLYGKLKESNSLVNWTLCTAESTVNKAIETAKPVSSCLEKPIKAVDSILYSGIDYVENKVPAVKLPPQQMIENTQQYVCETIKPAVKYANAVKDYGTQKLVDYNIIKAKTEDNVEESRNNDSASETKGKQGFTECSDCQAKDKTKVLFEGEKATAGL